MTEWWTYSLSDFLMFAPRTYYRLFELYNAAVWPGQGIALALGLLLALAVKRPRAAATSARAACLLLAAGWLWVAWAFHWQRYATINTAATWFAVAFAVEGLLWTLAAASGARWPPRRRLDGRTKVGLGLLLFALLVQPMTGLLFGRPWQQAGLFGLVPDPTAIGTLGLLLLLPAGARFVWLLWPVPLAWCLVSGATLWTMQAPEALLMPVAGVLAATSAWWTGRAQPGPGAAQ